MTVTADGAGVPRGSDADDGGGVSAIVSARGGGGGPVGARVLDAGRARAARATRPVRPPLTLDPTTLDPTGRMLHGRCLEVEAEVEDAQF